MFRKRTVIGEVLAAQLLSELRLHPPANDKGAAHPSCGQRPCLRLYCHAACSRQSSMLATGTRPHTMFRLPFRTRILSRNSFSRAASLIFI